MTKRSATIMAITIVVLGAIIAMGVVRRGRVSAPSSNASSDVYATARVQRILEEGKHEVGGEQQDYQTVEVVLRDGPDHGKSQSITMGDVAAITVDQRVKVGEMVVVAKSTNDDGSIRYDVVDRYRNRNLLVVGIFFILITILFGGWRGASALGGLVCTLLVIVWFIVPRILSGHNPMVVSVEGSLLIMFVSLYLAHGFSKRTSVALLSTFLTLVLAMALSVFVVSFTHLLGQGTEEAFYLSDLLGQINTKGLLLGGIIIGVLGVLDDVTTGQTAAVEELSKANPRLGRWELYRRGISIGKEHIASLVNTLVLAYAGASFPLFLLLVVGGDKPLWVTLNSEFMAEEIVRTLVGSSALILAVPISTILAATFLRRPQATPLPKNSLVG